MIRASAIARARALADQSVSGNRNPDPALSRIVLEAIQPLTNDERRRQVLADPTMCTQFAIKWGSIVGTLTLPTVREEIRGQPEVTGNFTDTLGQPAPVTMEVDRFRSYFTTLLPRGEAEALGLAIHSTAPDTLPGGVVPGRGARHQERAEPSLERLQFPMPEDPLPRDHPVIVALPLVLPLGPGQVLTHSMSFESGEVQPREEHRLLSAWWRGLQYVVAMNNGTSVTMGGPLFDWGDMAVDEFDMYVICRSVHHAPRSLDPTSVLYGPTRDAFLEYSDEVWFTKGLAQEPDVGPAQPQDATQPGRALGIPEPVLTRLLEREKPFKLYPRTLARYLALLACPPVAPGTVVVLPELQAKFEEVLKVGSGAIAKEELRELLRARVDIQRRSKLAHLRANTLEAAHVTLAYSDNVRCFGYLREPLGLTTLSGARTNMGFLHFLPPDRSGLYKLAEGETKSDAMVMANSSNDKAQLDATSSSKMYTAGKCSTFHDVYSGAVNMLTHFSVMTAAPAESIFLTKILELADVFDSPEGRSFCELNRHIPGLAVHGYQAMQSIMTAFLKVATDIAVQDAVLKNRGVDIANYHGAIAIADKAITNCKVTFESMAHGHFHEVPRCLTWFQPAPGKPTPGAAATKEGGQRGSGGSTPAGSGAGSKRQKTVDPEEAERRKAFGVLNFDSAAAGSNRLPVVNVFRKKRGAKNPERLCMKFLTVGHACTNPDCKLPHVSDLDSLPLEDRKKLLEFVERQRGLTWVAGKAPAGTA